MYSCWSDDIVSLHNQLITLCTVPMGRRLPIVYDLRHQAYKGCFDKEHVSLNVVMTNVAADDHHDELK